MSKIEKFIEDFDFETNLLFYGLPGRGKTFIMQNLFKKLPENTAKLQKYWLDDGFFREQITAGNMVLRDAQDYHCSVLNYPLEICIRCKILFFDDLGASENVSDAQKTKLKFILDEREKKGLVTIFSTNLTPTEIANLYGERIKSRIYNGKHPKGLQMIKVDGEDRRKENIKSITL